MLALILRDFYAKRRERACKVFIAALLNLAYFGIEFGVVIAIKSIPLFADSIDFLEDTFIHILIFIAPGWRIRRRAKNTRTVNLISYQICEKFAMLRSITP